MMSTTTKQVILVAAVGLCCTLLYGLGRTKPLKKKGQESEQQAQAAVNPQILLAEARTKLDSTKLAWLTELERQRSMAATNPKQEAEVVKLLSRTWNEWGNYPLGGFYASQVAQILQTGEAWAIAGTTYGMAFQRTEDQATKVFVAQQAVQAFQEAAKLEPDTVRHRINEALVWVDLSTVDPKVMPMKGAQLLLQLDKERPNDVLINLHLGRLSATRSGDWKKAIPRFENVLKLAAQQGKVEKGIILEANYFLADGYRALNDKAKALEYYDACIRLTEDNPALQAQLRKAKQELE